MDTDVLTQVPFNPATDWSGSCADDRVYFDTGSNSSDPPPCNNNNSVPLAAFKCNAALTNMALAGYYVADRAAQWRTNRWRGINGGTGNSVWVECRTDAGVHGNGVSTSALWAADGNNGPWSANSAQAIGWNSNGANQGYVFFSGNYINWLNNGSTITQSRLEIVQQVATQTINSLAVDDAVNVGLMQFSNNTNDGCCKYRDLRGRHGAARHGPGRRQPRQPCQRHRRAQRRRLHAALRVDVRGLPLPERRHASTTALIRASSRAQAALTRALRLRASRPRTRALTRARSRSPASATSSCC